MSKWSKFSNNSQSQSEATTPHLTMNLRQVVMQSGANYFEQLVEHRNKDGMVLNTEWVRVPTIYE